MSRNLDNAEESLNFNEEPVHEALKEVVEADEVYLQNLKALHEFEDLCWQATVTGRCTAQEAEEAIWDFINFVEGDTL